MSRRLILLTTLAAALAVVTPACVGLPIKLIWNASASVPIGLYEIVSPEQIDVTDLVAVAPPVPLAAWMAERGYLARGVPLLKRVMGLRGQRVCRIGNAVTVDAVPLGDALDRDRRGRALPVWQGCRRIGDGQMFLMNASVHDSLDGRYFGPIPARAVIGKATPLLTDEAGDGRFVWRAATR